MKKVWGGLKAWGVALHLACVGCGGAATTAQSPEAHSSPVTPKQAPGTLAERVTARIKALRPSATVEQIGPNQLHVKSYHELEVYLDNLATTCDNVPADCDARIELFAQQIAVEPTEKLSASAIFPQLKDQAYVDSAARGFGTGQPSEVIVFDVVGDLRMMLVLDLPTATRALKAEDLRKLALTPEAARDVALANLRAHTKTIAFEEVAPGLYALNAGDGYDAAAFLLQPEWQTVATRIGAAPVVIPIGRDIVLFASQSSPEGLSNLAKVVFMERRKPAAAYPITLQSYLWSPQGWSKYTLPEAKPPERP
jgi:uncharacterized protein YtpQ (UPF0354 family)